jgi:antitoxin MazE
MYILILQGQKMISRVLKWGNSLSVRLPSSFAKELNLNENSPINIIAENKKILISPVISKEYKLEEMVAQINEKNIHSEIKTGLRQGLEIW